MNYDLKIIKKKYGENMMHLCRTLFPSIIETPGLLLSILESKFSYNRYLCDDIIKNNLQNEFKNYIYGLADMKKEKEITDKSVKELLNLAGYDFYECKTEKDIQKFKKYFANGEELCTFNGGRLKKCYVFFAVKKNVDQIKRENFSMPKREDDYGTSVISIQFTYGDLNTLSIKNRYNHKVVNPDATFSNNLENIIPGLTYAFEKEYNLNIECNDPDFSIFCYNYAGAEGKIYKYNYEINNIYYCPDNIIIDNFKVIDKYKEKSRYLIIDYFILDLVEKKIFTYENDKEIEDSFISSIGQIKTINIVKTNGIKRININDKVVISIDSTNKIIGYTNNEIKKIDDKFLYYNIYLNQICINNVEQIGDDFLFCNLDLKEINLAKTKYIGNNFLRSNEILYKLYSPKLEIIGNDFLYSNLEISILNLPSLKLIKNNFISYNKKISKIFLPKTEEIGNRFLEHNLGLENIYLPNIMKIGNNFMKKNIILKIIYLPKVIEIGNDFLFENMGVSIINFPLLRSIGNNFFFYNTNIEEIFLSKTEDIGDSFVYNIEHLKIVYLPKIKKVGIGFLMNTKKIDKLKIREIENNNILYLCSNNENAKVYTK